MPNTRRWTYRPTLESLEERRLLSTFARTFPDTTDSIAVFVDQLNTSAMTPAQIEFAATNYVGTQKQLPGEIDKLRAYNPDFLMIQYRLGVRQSTPPFIHNGTWSSDWNTVNANDDWFVRTNDSNQRVYQRVGNVREYVMDISGRINGNLTNGWKEYWVDTVIADIDASRADGVFADSTHLPYSVPSNLWNSPIGRPPHTRYIDDMETFYDYVYPKLDEAHKYFIPNIGALVTTVDTTNGYYEDVHGAMVEGFGVRYDLNGPYAAYSEDDWRMQSNRILRLIGNDKIYIAETDESLAGPSDIKSRLWYMSNFLLLKHGKSFINMFPGGNSLEGQLHWWPEYELDLGAPLESATPGGIGRAGNVDSLRDRNGVYSREFERGIVLVNPGANRRDFVLDASFDRITPFGGGMIGPSGEPPSGGLTRTTMSPGEVVSLPPQTGAILLKRTNKPPTLDQIPDPDAIPEDAPTQTIELEGISAGTGENQPLRVTATSSNPALILHPIVTYRSPDPIGTLSYRPLPNQFGSSTISVTVTDGGLDGDLETDGDNAQITRTFEVVVDPVNDAPIAVDDLYSVAENTELQVAAAGVIDNDTDADGDSLSAILVQPPSFGTVNLEPSGAFRYLPDTNFNRTDSFRYRVTDGRANSNDAVVTIEVETRFPYFNGANPPDINDDGLVSPLDALTVILTLVDQGARPLPPPRPAGVPFYDPNRDGQVSPADALVVVTALTGTGEGEPSWLNDQRLVVSLHLALQEDWSRRWVRNDESSEDDLPEDDVPREEP